MSITRPFGWAENPTESSTGSLVYTSNLDLNGNDLTNVGCISNDVGPVTICDDLTVQGDIIAQEDVFASQRLVMPTGEPVDSLKLLQVTQVAGVPTGAASEGSLAFDTVGDDLYLRANSAWSQVHTDADASTLAQVLTLGNTTGSNDISMDAGQSVNFAGDVQVTSTDTNTNVNIGGNNTSQGTQGVLIGTGNYTSSGINSVIVGRSNGNSAGTMSGQNNTIVGQASGTDLTSGEENVFIGPRTSRNTTTGSRNVVLGSDADTIDSGTSDSIVLGRDALGAGQSVSMGVNSSSSGTNGISIGTSATTASNRSIAIGVNSTAGPSSGALYALAIGDTASALSSQSCAIGYNADATGTSSTAIGDSATATHIYSTVLGYDADSIADRGTVIRGAKNAAGTGGDLYLYGGDGTSALMANAGAVHITGSAIDVISEGMTITGPCAFPSGEAVETTNLLQITQTTGVPIATSVPGALCMDSAGGDLYYHDGTSWQLLSTGGGAGSSLADTLVIGATTSGTDIVVTSGDSVEFAGDVRLPSTLSTSNVISGYLSGDGLTSGTTNVLIGASAGQYVSSGTRNVCIGDGSASSTIALTTGGENVIIGYLARTAVSSDTRSLSIGRSAIAGSSSTAIGYSATASGTSATCVGTNSSATNTRASAFGYNADATGTNSLAIGYNSTASASNSIMIGTGTNSTTNKALIACTGQIELDSSDFLVSSTRQRFKKLVVADATDGNTTLTAAQVVDRVHGSRVGNQRSPADSTTIVVRLEHRA